MTISKEDWKQIERVFHLVCDQASDSWEAIAKQELDDRDDLVEEVRALLESDQCPDQHEFLETDPLVQLLNATESGLDTVGLVEQALGSQPDMGEFGPYDLIEQIGRGGMGVVYKARERQLDRIVALKLLPAGQFASDGDVELFDNEASSAGGLFHPAIVPVFRRGQHAQQNYIAMQFVEGETLEHRLMSGLLDPPFAASLLMRVARGVQHAHNANTVHADLKPSNILLDADDNPFITDFGLARRLKHETSRPFGGTPGYMAPEQARGVISHLSDVYSLGAVLYRVLAGRTPNPATSIEEVSRQPIDREPEPLRQLEPTVPADLETICMTCLRSEPSKRYASAEAFADDLERYLQGKPIKARPNSLAYWARKLVLRNKAISATVAAAAAVLLVAVGFFSYGLADRRSSLQRTRDSYLVDAVGRRNSRELGQRFKALEKIKMAASVPIEIDTPKQLQLRNEAIAAMALIDLDFTQPLKAAVNGCCVDSDFVRYAAGNANGKILIKSIDGDRRIASLAGNGRRCMQSRFHHSGQFIGAIHEPTEDHVKPLLRVWDITAEPPVVVFETEIHGEAWAFDPSTSRVLFCPATGGLYSYGLDSDEAARLLIPEVWLTGIAFHPKAALVAVASMHPYEIRILDVETGFDVNRIPCQSKVNAIAWQQDGQLLAVGCSTNINLWQMPSGRQLSTLQGHDSYVSALAFNYGGTILASVDYLGQLNLWEPWSGERLLRATSMNWIQFSNDDAQLSGARTEAGVGIWRFSPAEQYKLLKSVDSPSVSLSDSPDHGTWSASFSKQHGVLATSSIEGITFWNPRVVSKPIGMLPIGHCTSSVFSADGSVLYSSGKAGVFRWPIGSSPDDPQTIEIGPAEQMEWNPKFKGHQLSVSNQSGRLGIVQSNRGGAIVIDLHRREPLRQITAKSGVDSGVMSPDGNWFVTGTWLQRPAVTQVYDLRSERPATRLDTGDAWPCFSPDGRWLVTGSKTRFQFWRVDGWVPGISIPRSHADVRGAAAFNHNGSLIAVAHSMREVRLFDTATGDLVARLETRDQGVITFLQFSHDDSLLVATCQGRMIKVWDLKLIDNQLSQLALEPIGSPSPTLQPSQPITRVVTHVDATATNHLSRHWPAPCVAFKPAAKRYSDLSVQATDHTVRTSQFISVGDWVQAIESAGKAVEANPSDSLNWFNLALLYLQIGDRQRYDRHCKHMQERFGDASDIGDRLHFVITCFIGGYKPDAYDAQEMFVRKLVGDDPDSHPRLSMLGATLFRSNKNDEAIELLEEAIRNEKSGGNPADWLFLSMAYAKRGSVSESQELIARSRAWIQSHAIDEIGWSNKLKYHLLLAEATKLREDAFRIPISSTESTVDEPIVAVANTIKLGIAHAKRGEWLAASRIFKQGLDQSDSAKQWYLYALIQLKLGNRAEYGEACRELVRRFGKSDDRMDKVYLTWTCVLGIDGLNSPDLIDDVLRNLIDATPVGPKRHIYHNTRGLLLYRLHRYSEARAEMNTAMRVHTSDGNPADWLTLAMIESNMGRIAEAKRWYERACVWIDYELQRPANLRSGTWTELLEYQLLRDETEAVLLE